MRDLMAYLRTLHRAIPRRRRLLIGLVFAILLLGPIWLPQGWLQDEMTLIAGGGTLWIALYAGKKRRDVIEQAIKEFRPHNQSYPDHPMTPPTVGGAVSTTQRVIDMTVDDAVQVVRQLQNETQPTSSAHDDTLYWHQNPHIKHLIKRSWRIVICWLIVALGVKLLGTTVWSLLLVMCGVWYTLRRIKKWQDLSLIIQGDHLIIQEATSRLFLLNGKRYEVSILDCNNIETQQTKFELLFHMTCGRVDINTPIEGLRDVFQQLTDIRNYREFRALLKKRYGEILRATGGGQRGVIA